MSVALRVGLAGKRAGHGGGDFFVARAFARSVLDGTPAPIDVDRAMDFTLPGLISEQSIAAGGMPLAVPDSRDWQMSGPWPQLHMRRALSDLPAPVVPDGYALRPLSPADLPIWVELIRRNGELGVWSAERAASLFAGQMDLAASFVVTRGDAAVATAQLNPHGRDEYAPTPELGWVAADPAYRGRGLGRAVCLAVLGAAGAAGHREIFLRTDDHRRPAIDLYLSLGFVPWLRDPTSADRWLAIEEGRSS